MMDQETSQPSGQEERRDELAKDRASEAAKEPPHGFPTAHLEPAKPLNTESDHDLSRIGFWSLALAGLGLLVGITFFAIGGILPGTLVIAAALLVALVGVLVLLVVAGHLA